MQFPGELMRRKLDTHVHQTSIHIIFHTFTVTANSKAQVTVTIFFSLRVETSRFPNKNAYIAFKNIRLLQPLWSDGISCAFVCFVQVSGPCYTCTAHVKKKATSQFSQEQLINVSGMDCHPFFFFLPWMQYLSGCQEHLNKKTLGSEGRQWHSLQRSVSVNCLDTDSRYQTRRQSHGKKELK